MSILLIWIVIEKMKRMKREAFPEKWKFESLTKIVQIEYESNKYQIKQQNSIVYVKYNYYIHRLLIGSEFNWCVVENRLICKTLHVGAMPKTHEYEHDPNPK